MNKKTYSEQLRDPRWQKKRLEILQRDEFSCQCCFDSKRTLHVHHIDIDYSLAPWEHDDCTLITLCDSCHKVWHSIFDLPFDHSQISMIVKLHDRLEEEEIRRYIESKNNNEWPDQ